ncbi:MAG: hypothetical protein M1827_006195 [Pycnora praestabilis]|nr:MAG: hypothetical protein M1827_006195 [Pycnora praestabilis]
MTRPHIIRADTIDLQDQDAPSAKDHSRQPTHPAPLGAGPPAPHQAGAIRQADEIAAEEEHYQSPPVSNLQDNINQPSFEEGSDAYDLEHGSNGILNDQLNEQAVGQNGGHSGIGTEDADMADAEGDDGLDDDMMDKISSSPSIDDGGYHLSSFWPKRADSLNSTPAQSNNPPHSFLTINVGSSSPFVSTPSPFPLVPHKEQGMDPSEVHHLQGEYEIRGDYDQDEGFEDFEDEERDRLSPLISEQCFGYFREELNDLQDSYERDFDGHDIRTLLLPSDDPLLDNSFDDAPLSPSPTKSFSSASSSSWESDDELNDDDTKDFLFSDDPRYTDSGWGGECLREIEDIDFEFVYALHTFVATVEGQANATKGDTMVLLDDSNSYWWLVRVVKDSSIGG